MGSIVIFARGMRSKTDHVDIEKYHIEGYTVDQAYSLGAYRDSGVKSIEHTYADNDICLVELADESVLTLTPTEFKRLTAEVSESSTRSIKGFLFKLIAFYKPNDGVLASLISGELEHRVESYLISKGAREEGLYACQWQRETVSRQATVMQTQGEDQSNDVSPVQLSVNPVTERLFANEISNKEPSLIFIHGTLSSTTGSFGGLGVVDNHDNVVELRKKYGKRIYAFEHRTLLHNPVENTINLLKTLPVGAVLHLVSHSRGGIIGELLSCAMLNNGVDTDPINLEVAEKIFRSRRRHADGTFDPNLSVELKQLRTLNSLLKQKKPRVESFVRCACPIMGTSLLNEHSGLWLSTIRNVSKLSAFVVPWMAYVAKASDLLVTGLSAVRRVAYEVPGLEAMKPTSPLLAMLNAEQRTANSALAVIAGEANHGFKGVRVLAELVSKLVFDGRSDWVVDTRNMFGGLTRESSRTWYYLEETKSVDHFSYFDRFAAAERVKHGLACYRHDWQPEDYGFNKITDAIQQGNAPSVRSKQQPTQAQQDERPQLYLLPGIMGSYLHADDEKIWINIPSLVVGELNKLKIDSPCRVTPGGAVRLTYSKMIKHFSDIYTLHEFSFDWRLPIREEAARLARHVRKTLERQAARERAGKTPQPIYIMAHSMGGLVARAIGLVDASLWQDLLKWSPGFRLLMLGTPNNGSYSIVKALSGHHQIVNFLSGLDLPHSKRKVTEIISEFQGLIDLLPNDASQQWLSATHWSNLADTATENKVLVVPKLSALKSTRAFYLELNSLVPLGDETKDKVVYVAGNAKTTPIDVEVDPDSKTLKFPATHEGDGAVPWSTGIPKRIPTWYVDEMHGSLVSRKRFFSAYQEILEHGTTHQLSQTPPARRSSEFEQVLYDEQDTQFILPTEQDFESAFGVSRLEPSPDTSPAFEVCVAHGNLKFLEGCLVVGHYQGDTLVGAERVLNYCLNGVLAMSRNLNTYPGQKNSAKLFSKPGLNATGQLNEGLVIGLGLVGSLTAGALKSTFAYGVIQFLEKHAIGNESKKPITLSTLLIGSGVGGISIRACIESILKATIIANEKMRVAFQGSGKQAPQVQRLNLVELYEDTSLEALHTLFNIKEKNRDIANQFFVRQEINNIGAGRKRLFRQSDFDWWLRMDVSSLMKEQRQGYRFKLLADKSGAIEFDRYCSNAVVQSFIDEALASGGQTNSIANALYEVLLPRELKDYSFDDRDIMLVVDKQSASIPWELLDDKDNPETEPIGVRNGLLRQLSDPLNPIAVQYALSDEITVIGDPKLDSNSGYYQLPGAKNEAELVAGLFKDHSFAVHKSIQESSHEVIQTIVNHNSRVIHLAGHGVHTVYDKEAQATRYISGMVLNKNSYLNADIFDGFRRMPELVFINCCHLGNMSEDNSMPRLLDQPNELAASISRKLINMGVKAVIAAGWVVDDRIAEIFAKHFYQAMLVQCTTFGDAVRQARQAAYHWDPTNNTWGAYQCYGDPSYRMVSTKRSGTSKRADWYWDFVAVDEAIVELHNTRSSALASRDQKISDKMLVKLESLIDYADRKGWGRDTEFLSAVGMVYGEIGLYDSAIKAITRALDISRSEVTYKVVDELANYKARLAVEVAIQDSALAHRLIHESIEYYRDQVNKTDKNQYAARSKDPVIYNNLGSAYRCKVMLDNTHKERLESLKQMRQSHRQATQLGQATCYVDPFGGLQWATAELLHYWLSPRKKLYPEIMALLADVESTIERTLDKQSLSFWEMNDLADLHSVRLLHPDNLEDHSMPDYL